MKIDTAKVSYDGRWFAFGDARLKIRPLPKSRMDFEIKDGGHVVMSGESALERFQYCLAEWENVDDANKNPLALTDQVKKIIFDMVLGEVDGTSMSDFVLLTANTLRQEMEAEAKN